MRSINTVTIAAFCLLFLSASTLNAQDMRFIKHNIVTLSSGTMEGRGYTKNGRERAAKFITRNFKEMGLRSFGDSVNYAQNYTFNVNTFPDIVALKIGKTELQPGVDFLVDAASPGFSSTPKAKLHRVNLKKIKTAADWNKLKAGFVRTDVYELQHTDTLCNRLSIRARDLAADLPFGCFIIPQHNKLIWTVATDTISATVFYIADTSLPKGKKVTVAVKNKLEYNVPNSNIAAYIPGTQAPDSFIVFTAHYDHLGKMGKNALFPGANDNASGTGFMMGLARYFSALPQKYSIAFIAFSGEEAGLLGSKYYTAHPLFPLANIRMLINIDLMGDATDGITVVNAVKEKAAFETLEQINQAKAYLPKINSRDNAANSDHYPFTQAGVPAIFIYANGGKGYYHDVFDASRELSLKNVDKVGRLLLDYTQSLCR